MEVSIYLNPWEELQMMSFPDVSGDEVYRVYASDKKAKSVCLTF